MRGCGLDQVSTFNPCLTLPPVNPILLMIARSPKKIANLPSVIWGTCQLESVRIHPTYALIRRWSYHSESSFFGGESFAPESWLNVREQPAYYIARCTLGLHAGGPSPKNTRRIGINQNRSQSCRLASLTERELTPLNSFCWCPVGIESIRWHRREQRRGLHYNHPSRHP